VSGCLLCAPSPVRGLDGLPGAVGAVGEGGIGSGEGIGVSGVTQPDKPCEAPGLLGEVGTSSIESSCLEGDGPGRYERGVRGHNRDRAFR
jgi:hypothetical protein